MHITVFIFCYYLVSWSLKACVHTIVLQKCVTDLASVPPSLDVSWLIFFCWKCSSVFPVLKKILLSLLILPTIGLLPSFVKYSMYYSELVKYLTSHCLSDKNKAFAEYSRLKVYWYMDKLCRIFALMPSSSRFVFWDIMIHILINCHYTTVVSDFVPMLMTQVFYLVLIISLIDPMI